MSLCLFFVCIDCCPHCRRTTSAKAWARPRTTWSLWSATSPVPRCRTLTQITAMTTTGRVWSPSTSDAHVLLGCQENINIRNIMNITVTSLVVRKHFVTQRKIIEERKPQRAPVTVNIATARSRLVHPRILLSTLDEQIYLMRAYIQHKECTKLTLYLQVYLCTSVDSVPKNFSIYLSRHSVNK